MATRFLNASDPIRSLARLNKEINWDKNNTF